MKLEGEKKSIFELNVRGYKLEKSEGDLFSSDWLKGEAVILKEGKKLKVVLSHLLIEELEQLKEWFLLILNCESPSKRFNFIDSEVSCVLHKTGGRKWLKWIIRMNENEREFIDMSCTGDNIQAIIHQLDLDLKKYPCRCHKPHFSLSESEGYGSG